MKRKIFISTVALMVAMIAGVMLLTGCGKSKKEVIIYTCMEESRVQELKKKSKEKFKDFDVKVQSISTGNVAAKLKNEGTNIEADIIVDLETAHAENLKENFSDLKDFDDSIYLDGINTSDNYFIWIKYTMNLIIDKTYFAEHNLEIPKTYEDLLKPEYKGLIAMPDPKTSGTGYAFYLNAVNIMGKDKAIEYFKQLKDNLREYTASGSGPTNLLKQGEIAIALGMTAQGAEAINEGYNFEIIQLETGAPYNTTTLEIVKGKETREEVKEVFNWLINDFGVYDKENYMPDVVLKNQNNYFKNYPTNLEEANMTGIESVQKKEELMELWGEVNG